MASRSGNDRDGTGRRHRFWLIPLCVLFLAITVIGVWWRDGRLARQLVTSEPVGIFSSPQLLAESIRLARPPYEAHCAGCHGRSLQGDSSRGVPNLARNAWVRGNDLVDVEREILYGVRSGHPKTRNMIDMPALVRTGQISEQDARDVVEYLQLIGHRPYAVAASARGRVIYFGKGNCFDCHGGDARGVPDYGAPGLTGPTWLYGGDRQTLLRSITNGRHGLCPASVDALSAVQIRALAVYMILWSQQLAQSTAEELRAAR